MPAETTPTAYWAGTETGPTVIMIIIVGRVSVPAHRNRNRHTGRGEDAIRYPAGSCFFWIPDIPTQSGFRNDGTFVSSRNR